MPRVLPCAAVTLLSALGTEPGAAAGNLLPNGDFSSANQITGWTLHNDINAGTLSWNSDDANGNAGSGSIELDTDSFGEPTFASSTCFAVPGARTANVSARARVLSGPIGAMDYAFAFTCSVYASPDCSGGSIASISGNLPQTMSWSVPSVVNSALPDTAQSTTCTISEQNPFVAGVASVLFDDLSFEIEPVTNLLANGGFANADQIAGWTLFMDINAGTLSWNANDADANPNSGSIELDTDSFGEPTHADSECVGLAGGGAVRVDARAKVLTGPIGAMDYGFGFGCSFFTTPDCSGGSVAIISVNLTQATSWTTPNPTDGTAPVAARSANCSIDELNPFVGGVASVLFDNLLFTADYIFHDGFE